MGETMAGTGRLEVRKMLKQPPEVVFDAWTDAEGMRSWMRPGPTKEVNTELDVKVGGAYTIEMVFEEMAIKHTGEYLVVDRPSRLVFTWVTEAMPEGTKVSIEFNPVDGGTEVVLVHEGLPSEESVQNHTAGWTAILDALTDTLRTSDSGH